MELIFGEKTIKFMLKKGCNKKSIFAAIGPCINQKHYEVREDFFKKFIPVIEVEVISPENKAPPTPALTIS